jgi:hypothetical protein
MFFGKFGKFPFGKDPFFKAPIGVVAGAFPRFIGPGFASFPPGGFI